MSTQHSQEKNNIKSTLKNLILLMRPHQYIKNTFIILPLFFLGEVTQLYLIKDLILAFIAFSFCASSLYILNDYHDRQTDRLHPKKKNRPLAAGSISTKVAFLLMFVLMSMGMALMVNLSFSAWIVLFLYVLINFAYSFYLKHIAIIDISIIALGFVLRLFVGSFVADITLSNWIVILTFLLALFLALAKRRDDTLIFNQTGKKMRRAIDGYNIQFIDSSMVIMAGVIIVAYIQYTISIEVIQRIQNSSLYLTSFFVIIGIMRYLQITLVENNSGSPTLIVYKDKFIKLTLLGWILCFVWIIYL